MKQLSFNYTNNIYINGSIQNKKSNKKETKSKVDSGLTTKRTIIKNEKNQKEFVINDSKSSISLPTLGIF